MQLPGSLSLFLELAMLTLLGAVFTKKPWRETWMTALLLRSVLGILDSILRWIDYRILFPLVLKQEVFLMSLDTVRGIVRALLLALFFVLLLRHFYRSGARLLREQILLLTVPLFFIALVEQILQDSFYGDTMVVDTAMGSVLPALEVSHGENLFLQLVAGGCLIAVLFLYQRFIHVQLTEKKLFCLEQQAAEQKRYMEEATLREKQARAFRHDLKNHLMVLKELLRTGQTEYAYTYLSQLSGVADGFSCTVRTGNPAVDVLLGSKFAAAKQREIAVQCELSIPKESGVRDIDWCILLSNALDNAMNACEAVLPQKRYIRISGKKKGNFYLLLLENSCGAELRTPPPEGIGLSNIRAVLEPMEGTVKKTVSNGVYQLKLFFVFPQRKNVPLHQLAHLEDISVDNPEYL